MPSFVLGVSSRLSVEHVRPPHPRHGQLPEAASPPGPVSTRGSPRRVCRQDVRSKRVAGGEQGRCRRGEILGTETAVQGEVLRIVVSHVGGHQVLHGPRHV